MMQQKWNSGDYSRHGRFVAELAGSLLDLLQPQAGERILDLGCGDGFLTSHIAESGAAVVGVDSSPEMVRAARARGLEVHCLDAEALNFEVEFDAVFSNAALHWMPNQRTVLSKVKQALKPGGRLVAECGGQGNIAAIRVALLAVLEPRGFTQEHIENNYFFSDVEYRALLEESGFEVESIALVPRPTPLPSGIENWLQTFRNSLLQQLPESQRAPAIEEITHLLRPVLRDREGNWTADYVRLRFLARRPR
jgi:trans-aconitate methyltransferase